LIGSDRVLILHELLDDHGDTEDFIKAARKEGFDEYEIKRFRGEE